MNFNPEQFVFFLALVSFQGKDFKNNFFLIKQYLSQRNLNKDQLINFENLLYVYFLKNYESENTYNNFFNYFSKLYKLRVSKKFIKTKKHQKTKSILFFVISPNLLAHTVPLFNMLKHRKKEYEKLKFVLLRNQNLNFEKCFGSNSEFICLDGSSISNKLDNKSI